MESSSNAGVEKKIHFDDEMLYNVNRMVHKNDQFDREWEPVDVAGDVITLRAKLDSAGDTQKMQRIEYARIIACRESPVELECGIVDMEGKFSALLFWTEKGETIRDSLPESLSIFRSAGLLIEEEMMLDVLAAHVMEKYGYNRTAVEQYDVAADTGRIQYGMAAYKLL